MAFPQDILDAMPTDLFLDGEIWYVLAKRIFFNVLKKVWKRQFSGSHEDRSSSGFARDRLGQVQIHGV